jgi:VanZ family protein
MRSADRTLRFFVLMAWMAAVTYWSSQGNLPIDQPVIANAVHGLQHRIAHFFAFGLLALLACWAFDGLPRRSMLAIALASAFGAADEWHQSFTPGRRAAVDDWLLDTVFAAIAVYGWVAVSRIRWYGVVVRTLAPVAVCAFFMLALGLAARPTSLPRPSEIRSATVHTVIGVARQIRSLAG